jgi:hypothetical protein
VSGKGFGQATLDKLERRVQRRLDNNVPFDLWDHAEQQYHALYFTGGGCPSSPTIGALQVTEKRKRKDLP